MKYGVSKIKKVPLKLYFAVRVAKNLFACFWVGEKKCAPHSKCSHEDKPRDNRVKCWSMKRQNLIKTNYWEKNIW